MGLTQKEILQGLRNLGVNEGMVLMVHSSLSAFGEVEGGADTVISALVEAIGPTGTLCMPAMASERPFNVHTSPSTVGAITDRFRSWRGVRRGLHPTHSVCCLGPLAEDLIAGHIDQPTALGPESPWGRLARIPGAKVLLLGCDQDRNTLLHCAEEAVDAPYLSTIQRDYLDESGQRRTKVLEKFPGPHRDFISLDRVFREAGAMKVGKIGKAVCRLMDAGKVLELAIAALRADPAAVLCPNPNCRDCVKQRAAIIRHRLTSEDFTLSAVLDEVTGTLEDLEKGIGLVQDQGVNVVEIGPELALALIGLGPEALRIVSARISAAEARVSMLCASASVRPKETVAACAEVATALGAELVRLPGDLAATASSPQELAELLGPLVVEVTARGLVPVVENSAQTALATRTQCEALLSAVADLRLAFNPAHFARAGEHPFLETWYRGKLKNAVVQLYVTDGCAPGGEQYTLPGQGNGEVKELISILRCRSFDGYLCLRMANRRGGAELRRQAQALWSLMDSL